MAIILELNLIKRLFTRQCNLQITFLLAVLCRIQSIVLATERDEPFYDEYSIQRGFYFRKLD